jgi:hypothetical protein
MTSKNGVLTVADTISRVSAAAETSAVTFFKRAWVELGCVGMSGGDSEDCAPVREIINELREKRSISAAEFGSSHRWSRLLSERLDGFPSLSQDRRLEAPTIIGQEQGNRNEWKFACRWEAG